MENLNRELSHFLDHPLLPSGVKCIFTLEGERVDSLTELCGGGDFVAASNNVFKKIRSECYMNKIIPFLMNLFELIASDLFRENKPGALNFIIFD